MCVIECLMLVKLSGVIRLGASFVSGFARSIEALADLFVAVGDPYVSVEAVCVLALIFWRGKLSYLALIFTIIAVISLETSGAAVIGVPTLQDLVSFLR